MDLEISFSATTDAAIEFECKASNWPDANTTGIAIPDGVSALSLSSLLPGKSYAVTCRGAFAAEKEVVSDWSGPKTFRTKPDTNNDLAALDVYYEFSY